MLHRSEANLCDEKGPEDGTVLVLETFNGLVPRPSGSTKVFKSPQPLILDESGDPANILISGAKPPIKEGVGGFLQEVTGLQLLCIHEMIFQFHFMVQPII